VQRVVALIQMLHSHSAMHGQALRSGHTAAMTFDDSQFVVMRVSRRSDCRIMGGNSERTSGSCLALKSLPTHRHLIAHENGINACITCFVAPSFWCSAVLVLRCDSTNQPFSPSAEEKGESDSPAHLAESIRALCNACR
jgi:hypothetical protein